MCGLKRKSEDIYVCMSIKNEKIRNSKSMSLSHLMTFFILYDAYDISTYNTRIFCLTNILLYLYRVSLIRFLLHEKIATSMVIPFSFLMPCNLTLIEGPKSGGSADTPFDSGIPTQI